MAKRPCAIPGCGELVDRGHCIQHQAVKQQKDRWRGTSHSRGYDAAWRRVRIEALKRDQFVCQEHKKKGIMVPADEVHHVIAIEVNPALRLVLGNLESLCHACHVAKTWQERASKDQ